jgi:serine/threonine protein kinase
MPAPNDPTLRPQVDTRLDPDPNAATGFEFATGDVATMGPDLEERIKRRLADHDDATSVEARADPLIGRVINQRFEVVSKIGAGGMGAVYRARQRGMQRDVAIKVLLRELTDNETVLRRFHLEALAVSKLRHPNTIQIFDFGETEDGLLYIAMELLEGRPLLRVLADEHQLSVKRALHVLQQAAKSLREAHGKGIVHRDLKPDNIFLQTVGEDADFVKVLDFGVAKVADGDGHGKTLTKAGSIFGTPKYMSPEQSRGGDIDARSDLYALGVILYELLTGRVPFNAENPLGILIKHIQEVPPPFGLVRPDLVIPEAVERFVLRLLAKQPDARPQTAEALVREAEKLEAELPPLFRSVVTRQAAEAAGIEVATLSVTAHDTALLSGDLQLAQTTFPVEPPPTPKRRWVTGAVLAAGLLLAGGGGLYASLPRLPAPYLEVTRLAGALTAEVPEFDVNSVYVSLVSTPPGAGIFDASNARVGETPHELKRKKGAPSERYTFRKDGFIEYGRTIDFNAHATVTFDLDPVETLPSAPSLPTPPVAPKPAPVAAPPVAAPPVAALPVTAPPVAEPPARAPIVGPRQVDATKANPYGAPAPAPARANPYD